MDKMFTIGYEGADIMHFVAALKEADVDLVLDVRELPLSRKRGFSKTSLKEALVTQNIEYRHERALGSPRTMRHRLRSTGDYQAFFQAFNSYLESQTELIRELARVLTGNVALMCFEGDHQYCHRSSVARVFETATGIEPIHLSGTDKTTSRCVATT